MKIAHVAPLAESCPPKLYGGVAWLSPVDCAPWAFGCAYRKSNPGILMVQSAQDRTTDNASGCLGGA